MPSLMIEDIRNIPFGATTRTYLESEIAFHKRQMTSSAAQLTRYFLVDTLFQNRDSVRLWLSRQESLESGFAIVDSWLHQNNIVQATLALNEIPQQYQMSITQQIEFNYFVTLKQLQMELIEREQTVYDLDSLGLQVVIYLAENSSGVAGFQAKNILNEGYDYAIYDDPILPDLEGGQRIGINKNQKNLNTVFAFPNPASEIVHFKYQVKRKYSNMSLRIWNTTGVLIEELIIPEGKEGFLSWDTKNLIDGFYFYSICTNKEPLAAGKFVVNR